MAYPVPSLASGASVLDASGALRAGCVQLSVIAAPGEPFARVISLDDLLSELLTANPP